MKRSFDVVVAVSAILLLLPVFLVISILVRILLGTPILFMQLRGGRNGLPFKIVKFRTMIDAKGADGRQLVDEDRLTRFGKFLRSSSLDELPELWNVLYGDMSVVGPRPLLYDYMPYYSCDQARRHDVRPGITGWAQVNGRNELDWEQKFSLDVWYVEHRTFWLDMKIILLTLWKVLLRRGISADGHATMPFFAKVDADILDNSASDDSS